MRRKIWVLVMAMMLAPLSLIQAQNVEYVGSTQGIGAIDVKIVGNYAYCPYAFQPPQWSGFAIFDISSPSSPNFIGQIQLLNYAFGVDIHDSYVYIANDAYLKIIDISNPAIPNVVGNYIMSGYAIGVHVMGDYAHIACGNSGLQIIDVSDPATPAFAGSYDTPGDAGDVFVLDNYAYVADYFSGLQIIDISNSSAPTLVGNFDTPGYAAGVNVIGNYAYVADGSSGLQIINISNPNNPIWVGGYETQEHALKAYIQGYYAYLAEYNSGLHIIDVSNPAAPTLVGSYDTPGQAYAVYVSGDYIYVADTYSLQILRFNPTGISEDSNEIPTSFSLSQNYPNPFNPTTQINYSLPKDDDINISIYNLLGQKVATLLEGKEKAGEHSIIWDGRDFPSGVYFARMEAGWRSENIKMLLIK